MGIHHDWVGIGTVMHQTISLAADGSLWHWSGQDRSYQPLLAASRKPEKIENIFEAQR
jgi:hypothetical protein